MVINSKQTFTFTKIYFNEVLHLAFRHPEVVGFQSWKEDKKKYLIELTFVTGTTLIAEYDEKDKWSKIIELISQVLGE